MFKISTFEVFFEPYLDKYSAFYEFIREQIQFISNEEAKYMVHNQRLLSEPRNKKKKSLMNKITSKKQIRKSEMKVLDVGVRDEAPRVLTVVDQSETDAVKEESQREGVIFRSGLKATIKLEKFKTVFGISGISSFDEGRNSLITSSMYNQVKTLIQLERSGVQEDFQQGS